MLVPSLFRNTYSNNFFDDFFDMPFAGFPKAEDKAISSLMRTDIKELKEGYELDIDLPGFKKEDVKAQLKDGYLTISAKTNESEDKEEKTYLRRERFFTSCQRSFYVGENLTEEDIKASFENGILHINLPKKELQKQLEEPKYISIM